MLMLLMMMMMMILFYSDDDDSDDDNGVADCSVHDYVVACKVDEDFNCSKNSNKPLLLGISQQHALYYGRHVI